MLSSATYLWWHSQPALENKLIKLYMDGQAKAELPYHEAACSLHSSSNYAARCRRPLPRSAALLSREQSIWARQFEPTHRAV